MTNARMRAPIAILEDEYLSLAAKGLLLRLLAKPDDYVLNIDELIAESPEGRTAIYSCLRELNAQCYLSSETVRDESGRFVEIRYTIYEERQNPDDIGSPVSRGMPERLYYRPGAVGPVLGRP